MELGMNGEILLHGNNTIFDDAEHFSKNYNYKLLPINFEIMNEEIILTEHNYCNIEISSGSESEDYCSRTIGYIKVNSENFNKRKFKFKGETGEIN